VRIFMNAWRNQAILGWLNEPGGPLEIWEFLLTAFACVFLFAILLSKYPVLRIAACFLSSLLGALGALAYIYDQQWLGFGLSTGTMAFYVVLVLSGLVLGIYYIRKRMELKALTREIDKEFPDRDAVRNR